MMKDNENSFHPMKQKRFLSIICLLTMLIGILFRFYHIAESNFVFFDEGFYLNHNRTFAQFLIRHYPANLSDFLKAVSAYTRICLASGKSLWFMIADARIFWGGMEEWFVPRVISAAVGSLTLLLLYQFASRFFNSSRIGWLSAVFLAVLPSHVFYSRIGLQEALSTFLVLAGFYFYVFPRRFRWQTFASGLFFAAAFFANYRLIILPFLVALSELWISFASREKPNFRKYLWSTLTFFCCVFMIGNINRGQNTVITFAWMFHQANLAEQHFDPVNFLSYPYYIFRLENILFGVFFFGNIFLLFKRKWLKLFPFFLVCLQIVIFSFASEKGARYLCVMTPFMAMAVAYLLGSLLEGKKEMTFRVGLILCLLVMTGLMMRKSWAVASINSDYQTAAEFLMVGDRNVKFLSTQNYVQNLYTPQKKNVLACPHQFPMLVNLYQQGYRYLVLCPQTYISWTEDEKRFNPKLAGYLDFITRMIKPIKTFPHFDDVMLERFVFEHNENLKRSIRFLQSAKTERFGELRVYDLSRTVPVMLKALAVSQKDRGDDL